MDSIVSNNLSKHQSNQSQAINKIINSSLSPQSKLTLLASLIKLIFVSSNPCFWVSFRLDLAKHHIMTGSNVIDQYKNRKREVNKILKPRHINKSKLYKLHKVGQMLNPNVNSKSNHINIYQVTNITNQDVKKIGSNLTSHINQ